MKSINYVIVELEDAYENKVKLSTGDDFIVNSTIENLDCLNRIASVILAPDFTILKKGDRVVVHHNIFRLRNGIKGNLVESNYYLGDNKYLVPLTEIFMYNRDNTWKAIDPYCFVKPIKKEKTQEGFILSTAEDTYKGNIERIGKITYPNIELEKQGVKSDDTVFFKPDSEYEIRVDGVTYYKMNTRDILYKL